MGTNRVRFIQRENVRGLLVPLFVRMLGKNERRGFEEMNRALNVRTEQAVKKDRGVIQV